MVVISVYYQNIQVELKKKKPIVFRYVIPKTI